MSANPRVNQNLDNPNTNASLYTSNPNTNNFANTNANTNANKNNGSREATSREDRFNSVKSTTVNSATNPVNNLASVRVEDENEGVEMTEVQPKSSFTSELKPQAPQPTSQLERQPRQKRLPFVEVSPIKTNKMRRSLEGIKGCFESRLSDSDVLDAMIRCAENIEIAKLAKHIVTNNSKPIRLPDENDFFEFVGEEVAVNNQGQFNDRQRNIQVILSIPTYRYLSGIQKDLAEEMNRQLDMNALANAIIDIGRHKPRQIVLALSEHFEQLEKSKEFAE